MRLWLMIAFLLVPIVEIYVLIQIGQVIGAPWTLALLLFESALGAWIVKREGRRAWEALQTAMTTGRMPGAEVADAALVLVGGTLLLTPGFVTDVVGFFFVLPPTRPLARRMLAWFIARRVTRMAMRHEGRHSGRRYGGMEGGSPGGPVVSGQVVDDDPKTP
jgi:UPF0716 protein FxsA